MNPIRKRNNRVTPSGPLAVLLLALLLLSGCAGGLRTETIVIPDTAEPTPADAGGDVFEVNTIYRLASMDEKYSGVIRWASPDELIRLSWDNKGSVAVDRYVQPFEQSQRVLDVGAHIIDFGSLSPDGRYFTGFAYGDKENGDSALTLQPLPDGERQSIDTLQSVLRLGARTLAWSNNSRFVSYFSISEQGEIWIEAYDTESGTKKTYAMPDQIKTAFYLSVRLSDDGSSALIVKEGKNDPLSFELGKLKENKFETQYEHTLNQSGAVDWLDGDRVAFVGTDRTLFSYDLRNEGYSVLLDQVDGFALSDDRQYIAYATAEATVDVAKLQGNNLLSKKTVYRGFVADQLSWSPDGGALLIHGRKPYDGPIVAKPSQDSDIKYSYAAQLIVVDFLK
ncbi:hypothetical protein RB620_26055 [Paenibacillus sp. LHD-117]|uniref:hypothetical protein n=1 Tax=Paenibacillus sp. LHD-117 TaxID=3071412 RepID=UPI0027E1DBCE|nr:hypothetical protein [Paenibacillus sp. LHD-117]MDQ6422896.1 hypothetical protein [Paenibacillus sp. LHD-117]